MRATIIDRAIDAESDTVTVSHAERRQLLTELHILERQIDSEHRLWFVTGVAGFGVIYVICVASAKRLEQ